MGSSEEVDEEVVELRRSTRKTERVSYEETIDDLDIVERRVKYLRNMMRYVPDELKDDFAGRPPVVWEAR